MGFGVAVGLGVALGRGVFVRGGVRVGVRVLVGVVDMVGELLGAAVSVTVLVGVFVGVVVGVLVGSGVLCDLMAMDSEVLVFTDAVCLGRLATASTAEKQTHRKRNPTAPARRRSNLFCEPTDFGGTD